jgi:hypothetical protein
MSGKNHTSAFRSPQSLQSIVRVKMLTKNDGQSHSWSQVDDPNQESMALSGDADFKNKPEKQAKSETGDLLRVNLSLAKSSHNAHAPA